MIEVNADIIEYTEDDVKYIQKEYIITSSYPNTIVKVTIDQLKNQTYTNDEGEAIISTSNIEEHTLKVTINGETITKTL